MTNRPIKIAGLDAINTAAALGLPLSAHADSVSPAREITALEAREIAAEDEGLVYCMVPVVMGDIIDGDDDGPATIAAEVAGHDTCWSIVTSVPGPGYEPAGDSIDCWVDPDLSRLLDTDPLLVIGREIVARAKYRR